MVDRRVILQVFNKIFCGKRVEVEWGIGRLKSMCALLRGKFPYCRARYADVFIAACLLHNMVRDFMSTNEVYNVVDAGIRDDNDVNGGFADHVVMVGQMLHDGD